MTDNNSSQNMLHLIFHRTELEVQRWMHDELWSAVCVCVCSVEQGLDVSSINFGMPSLDTDWWRGGEVMELWWRAWKNRSCRVFYIFSTTVQSTSHTVETWKDSESFYPIILCHGHNHDVNNCERMTVIWRQCSLLTNKGIRGGQRVE